MFIFNTMPKPKKHYPKSDRNPMKVTPATELNDIKIDDFANSMLKRSKSKKICISNITKNVEVLKLDESQSGSSWSNEGSSEELMDLDLDLETDTETPKVGGKRKAIDLDSNSESDDGFIYPTDIWFLISQYIKPEDVGTFALICRTTYYVVSTAYFWFNLYKKNHKWCPELPDDLQSWNMYNIQGLRASVIRSLFYTYPPFVDRIANENTFCQDTSKLIKSQCVLQWQIKLKSNQRKYYFKLLRHDTIKNRGSKHGMSMWAKNTSQTDSVVHYNSEEGYYILEVLSSELCNKHITMGMYLSNISLGLSRNLCNHKLKLTFTPSYCLLSFSSSSNNNKMSLPNTEVTLDPALSVRIYPWWHPSYFPAKKLNINGAASNPVL